MGCYRIAILCSVLLIGFSAAKEYVPVLLLESLESATNDVGVTALSKLSADEFKKYLLKLIENQDTAKPPLVVVFAEESLSVEDFSSANAGDYGSYPQLMKITRPSNSLFLPAVRQPLKALESLRESGFKWIKYPSSQISKAISSGKDSIVPKVNEDTKGVILYIDMEDANTNEDRPDMLRRHDTFIADTFEKLKNDGSVIAIYTSDHSSWYETEEDEFSMTMVEAEDEDYVREIRSSARHLLAEPDEDPGDTFAFYSNDSMLLFSETVPTLYKSADSNSGLQLDGAVDTSSSTKKQSKTLSIKYTAHYVTLRISFEESSRRYWRLTKMAVEVNSTTYVLKPNMQIEAPIGFSYHCAQNIEFKNSSEPVRIVFEGMQVQSFAKGDKIAFGDGYDCIYFFTAPIWSGLFVTMLLAFIMIWGLSMIMDIRTMDRFDDPKGKTITIGAGE